MLSVLIPTYNYDCTVLIKEIHKQADFQNINFEIIVLDDASDDIKINSDKLKTLTNFKLIKLKQNAGRAKARHLLAQKAKYDWLLFLDADVFPTNHLFISNYLKEIKAKYDVFFGGCTYEKYEYSDNLRYNYGCKFETKAADKKNKTPYKHIIAGNFMIKKNIFVQMKIMENAYGEDNLYAYFFKTNHTNILHINNNVYHKGIESNKVYLHKVETFIIDLKKSMINKGKFNSQNTLLKWYLFFKRTRLKFIFSVIFNLFREKLKNKIIKKGNPYLLQVYKLGFILGLKD